jgi:hypothetical protein
MVFELPNFIAPMTLDIKWDLLDSFTPLENSRHEKPTQPSRAWKDTQPVRQWRFHNISQR